MTTRFQLAVTYPLDIEAAAEQWGANCGPCAAASILGATLHEVRDYCEDIHWPGYTNVTHMKALLDLACVQYRSLGATRPRLGLAFVQWGGHDHQPIRIQYGFTHWIAVEGDRVFEVNAPEIVSWTEWQQVMPRMMQEAGKGDGSFRIRSGLEVRRKR